MKKESILKLNKREAELVKDALDNQKTVVRIKATSENVQRRELAINELYNIENANKASLDGKKLGFFSSVDNPAGNYYQDKTTGKKFAIVRN